MTSDTRKLFAGLAVMALMLPGARAATLILKPETVQSWDDYLQEANARFQERLAPGNHFLWMDEAPDRAAKVKENGIIAAPAGQHIPMKVPSGLIHDWIAVAYMPNLTIRDVLPVVRDYGRYKEFYRPNVIDSKVIDLAPELGVSKDRFSIVLMNRSFFKKTALDSDYEAAYYRVDDRRLYTISQTKHIREIAEYGAPDEHALPEDKGTGLIWRLFTIIRYEERDGGLYIEVEAIALSRDIPAAVRVFAEPIVRRVSRDALITSLKQTEAAVRAGATLESTESARGSQ
jgi:hypothetical protein